MYRTREEQGICHRQICCKLFHLYGYTTLTGIIVLAMLVTFVTFVSYHYHIHILWFLLSEGKDSYCWGVDWDWVVWRTQTLPCSQALLDISILSDNLSRFLFDCMDLLAKIVFSCVISCSMLAMFQQIYQNSKSPLRIYFYFINSFLIDDGKLLVGGWDQFTLPFVVLWMEENPHCSVCS